MNVLSLFDGISCARVALEKAGIKIEKYYASEIDRYAIKVAQKNYPDTIQLGDVRNITKEMVGSIDLIIGGSPCQDLSIAKNGRRGLSGERSSLFYEFVRLIKEVHPKWWVLENVNSMSEVSRNSITKCLGENCNMSMYWKPVMIDASLVSAQSRKRLFWTNLSPIKLLEDKGITLRDILQSGSGMRKSYCLPATYYKENVKSLLKRKKIGLVVKENSSYRKLNPVECERLQGLPDNYTDGISNTQRYKCLGNAFNVNVVTHIVSHIPLSPKEKDI